MGDEGAESTFDVVEASLGCEIKSAQSKMVARPADLLGVPLEVGVQSEATALGAAMLAGNVMESPANMSSLTFEPRLAPDLREQQYSGWRDWLERAQALGK